MQKISKKFFTLWLPFFIGIFLTALRLPSVENFVLNFFPTSFDNALKSIIPVVLIVLLSSINHLYTVVAPFDKTERFDKYKWDFLDVIAKDTLRKYKDSGKELSINLMVIRWYRPVKIEPDKDNPSKIALTLSRIFEMIWWSKSGDVDVSLVVTENQGVCGQAFRTGKVHYADLTQSEVEYNFNKKQIAATRDLKFVLSCPVFKIDGETNRLTKSVIGVINVESRKKGSENLVNSEEERDELVRLAEILSALTAKLL